MAKNPLFEESFGISLIFRIYLGKRHSISTKYVILALLHSLDVIVLTTISRHDQLKCERTLIRLVPTNVLLEFELLFLVLEHYLIATTKKTVTLHPFIFQAQRSSSSSSSSSRAAETSRRYCSCYRSMEGTTHLSQSATLQIR